MFSFLSKKTPVQKRIYMDNAAATPVRFEALAEVVRVSALFGNPGALHKEARDAKDALTQARKDIAHVCAVKPDEIIFTSGATESNNIAIRGFLQQFQKSEQPAHVVSTALEHSSVLEVLTHLESEGKITCTYIAPNTHGEIKPETLAASLTPQTRLVSIGWANGEIGTVQPMRALVQTVRQYAKEHHIDIAFHTDAGQAAFAQSPQPHGIGVDMMSMGSGKLYGPRGIGVVFIRHGISVSSIVYGGSQESGIRPGTEEPALAAGFAKALVLLEKERTQEFERLSGLRRLFLTTLSKMIPQAVVNGTNGKQLPHICNVSVSGIDSEYVALALDFRGVAISTKSVCVESTGDPVSHVVKALGGDPWRAQTTLRFSFGKDTAEDDVHKAVETLRDIIHSSGSLERSKY